MKAHEKRREPLSGIAFEAEDTTMALAWGRAMRPRGWRLALDHEAYEEMIEIGLRGIPEVVWAIHRAPDKTVVVCSQAWFGMGATVHETLREGLESIVALIAADDEGQGVPWESRPGDADDGGDDDADDGEGSPDDPDDAPPGPHGGARLLVR